MPLADVEARRAYDRERSKARYQPKGGSCEICGAALSDGRRKFCGSPECRRKYKTQKQRVYNRRASPEALERRRARGKERNRARAGNRNSWEWNLKHVHGLYPEQWHAMFMEQRGMCYLGDHPLPDDRKHIHVEHDHSHCGSDRSCGVCRRGLACSACNAIIGFASEDPHRLRVIADRLEQQQQLTRALIVASPAQGILELGM
jgi:hypothetical protein